MKCKETHPWLQFDVDLKQAPAHLWMMLGECQSKCAHLASIPLYPQVQEDLSRLYLAKGVAATAAIEGNTLSENQVLEQIEGKLNVAPSQEYLKTEIDNILKGANLILREIKKRMRPPLSVERIKLLNKIILKGLQRPDDEAVPGEIRCHSVGVGNYRGAPADECLYLLSKLCDWLNTTAEEEGMEIVYAILKAIIAHVYIAWIHPFGDGNGRTARLLEVQILLSSGVPSPAAQLLSNHYNATRLEYYRHLDVSRGDILDFIAYAVEGFRDGLRQQIETVQLQQLDIAWRDYVHERFDGKKGSPHNRRKYLILDLSDSPKPVPLSKIRLISPRVAVEYKDLAYRTFLRDIAELVRMDLIVKDEQTAGLRAKKEAMLSFFPARAV